MKKIFNTKIMILACLVLLSSSCELETTNPNAPTENEVHNTRVGIIALSVGLRQFYSTAGLQAAYLYPGMTTKEVKGVSTLISYTELESGGSLLPTGNLNVLNLWSRMQQIGRA